MEKVGDCVDNQHVVALRDVRFVCGTSKSFSASEFHGADLRVFQAAFTETGLARDLHTSHEVTILSISLYVTGLGLGPLFVGPLSELYGRNIVYRISYILFFAFTWPTAFPPDIGTCVQQILSNLR